MTTIDTNLEIFNPRIVELHSKVTKYKELQSLTISSKEERKKVHEAQMDLQWDRLEIKEIFEWYEETAKGWLTAIKTKKDEVINIIKPLEDSLKEEKNRFDQEEKEKKKKKEEEEEQVLQARISKLNFYKYEYTYHK